MAMIPLQKFDQMLSDLQVLAEYHGLADLATKLTDARQSANREICIREVLDRGNMRSVIADGANEQSMPEVKPH